MFISRRAGIAIGAVATLAAGFAGGVAVAGSDGQRTVAGDDHLRQPISLANADLAPATSCDDLLDWYVERGADLVGPSGWESPMVYFAQGGVLDSGTAELVQPANAPGSVSMPLAASERSTASATGTNVQEAGIDEPDVVKTDGELLVRVQDGDLITYDVSGDEPDRLASLALPDPDAELLLAGDRVVVIMGRDQDAFHEPSDAGILVVDVADPDQPTVVDEAAYDASLVTARQHGGTVRLVLSAGLPDLDFVEPGSRGRGEDTALEKNRAIVRGSTIEDWLPTVTRDDDSERLLDCADVALPSADAGLGTLAVVGIDPAEPETWSVSAVATTSQTTYFSPDRMYLATGYAAPSWGCCPEPLPMQPEEGDGSTDLYAFALDGTDATYVAAGAVDGAIRDRWAMDEAGGVLRVAVGPTVRTGNFNSVVTLEEDGDDLVEIGRVDKLGVNETIQSVRWFDGLAIVVTFRQVDPLYAVDLTDPGSPRLLGKLKIPGFSEYLHPLGRHRLLGLGQGPGDGGRSWGAQASLFNVSDLTDPRQLDVVHFRGGSVAGAGTDPRQFTWLPQQRTVLTVISSGPATSGGRTGWISVLTLDGGPIEKRMVEVEYGVEVDDVRTVPLPDGRVLLVTGDAVSAFPL